MARSFDVMTKPTGAICNLDCAYCYFLSKEELYPGSKFRMSDEVLQAYLTQMFDAHDGRPVTLAWQGGEPTMMGLDFFRRAVAIVGKLRRPGQRVEHALQTNATLIDAEWAEFLAEHDFLVGVSIDGPGPVHDTYRRNKAGRGSFDRVMAGLDQLKSAGVRWNALTTVHAANEDRGGEVYRFLRDDVGAEFMQFIPIVELPTRGGIPFGTQVTDRSVSAAGYGRFMIEVFDEWVRHDVGTVYVQAFDTALGAYVGTPGGVCVQAETCGTGLAMEHTGDVYSCDHFVAPEYRLGNVLNDDLGSMAASERQRAFGLAKRGTLTAQCRSCPVRFACNGGCPKDRISVADDGEGGQNYLCAGYRAFFTHIDGPMRFMASRVRVEAAPAEVMSWIVRRDERRARKAGEGAADRPSTPLPSTCSEQIVLP